MLANECKDGAGHLLSVIHGRSGMLCRRCHFAIEEPIGILFECPACNKTFTLDKITLDECHSRNLLCLSCARKLAIIKAAYQQILCERGMEQLTQRCYKGQGPDD